MKALIHFFQQFLKRLREWRLFGSVSVVVALIVAVTISWGIVQAASPASRFVNGPIHRWRTTSAWNSVVVYKAGTRVVNNYNYLNGHSHKLVSLPANSSLDGVSPDGHDLLYQTTQGQQTLFYTLRGMPLQGYFFSHIAFDTGNAIWLPDNRHVLISTRQFGVAKVDTRDGSFEWLHAGATWFDHLLFQYNGYLYFQATDTLLRGNIYRVGIDGGVPQNLGLNIAHDSNIMLSPSGLTLYFQQTGGGTTGLFSMHLDGSHVLQLRAVGVPVGFAADNTLLYMRRVSEHEQVVKLGATVDADSIVIADAAPGSTSADEAGAAMAPYGHALFIHSSKGGQSSVWSTDLISHQQFSLTNLQAGDKPIILPGWDRISVP